MKVNAFFVFTILAMTGIAQEMEVCARIIDADSRQPLTNVTVKASYCNVRITGSDGLSFTDQHAKTDDGGVVRFKGKSNNGEVVFSVHGCDEYYDSRWVTIRGGKGSDTMQSISRFFVPKKWVVKDDALIALRKVGNPIPLGVKWCDMSLTDDMTNVCQGVLGFDLMEGEWLPPVGKGKFADIEFVRKAHEDWGVGTLGQGSRVSKRIGRDEMVVRFVGSDNGIAACEVDPSETLRIRIAPIGGYKSEHVIWRECDKSLEKKSSDDENRCFAFRIRTKRNDKGEIVRAYYGKFYGNPKLNGGGLYPVKGVEFFYYLNPTSLDRNLEWDRKHNLFKNAKAKSISGLLP